MVASKSLDSEKASQSAQFQRRLLVVFLVVTANITATAPVVLLLGDFRWLFGMIVVGSIIVSILGLFLTDAPGPRYPCLLEYVFGWLGATCPPAFVSILWLTLYISIIAIGYVARRVAPISFDTHTSALWISGILATVLGVFSLLFNDWNLSGQLFPPGMGAKSAFDDLLSKGRGQVWRTIRLPASVAVMCLIIAVFQVAFGGIPEAVPWFSVIVLEISFIVVGLPLWMDNATPGRSDEVGIVDNVARLFETAGFEVETNPKTKNANEVFELGPIDLYLRINNGPSALCIVRLAPIDDLEIERWLAELTRASWIFGAAQVIPDSKLHLVIVLIADAECDGSQTTCDKQDGIWVLRIPKSAVLRILNEAAVDAKPQQKAQTLLGLSVWLGEKYMLDDRPRVDEVQHAG